ncbi:MAG: YbjQ family protein [Arenicella sp.]|nr:YbjQ family protein [Arenicella sp.]
MFEIFIVLSLLALGYGFGSYREKRHYQSIFRREEDLRDIMVFETRFPENPEVDKGGELVHGNVVISVDYFKMFVAGLRKLVGGRLRSYETLLDRGRREAVLRMKQEARAMGANKILNVKFETASVSQGEQGYLGSIEVFVYGSAVNA